MELKARGPSSVPGTFWLLQTLMTCPLFIVTLGANVRREGLGWVGGILVVGMHLVCEFGCLYWKAS